MHCLIQSNLAIREKSVAAFFSLIARFLLLSGFARVGQNGDNETHINKTNGHVSLFYCQ